MYDIRKEVCNAFLHLAEHATDVESAQLAEEYAYLDAVELPDYFYNTTPENSDTVTQSNLTEWITQAVYSPEERQFSCKTPDAVIILGSRSCAYRVEATIKAFGNMAHMTFICSGGNLSEYTDGSGNEIIEADYIRGRLVQSGIDADSIITERDSHNTYENLKYSIELCHHCSNYVVVTAGFHRTRVRQLLDKLNCSADIFSVYGPNTHIDNWYKNKTGIEIIFDELTKTLA
jgi:uncharacterized SAM-binding protein YcdF (DUF218 family)